MKKTWPIEIDCPNCAAKLERAMAEMPGVEYVSVNYVQKRITLEAADSRFDEVVAAMLAKTAEVEPDAVIHMEDDGAHACRGKCACGHEHNTHAHHHEHAGHMGRRLLLRAGLAILLLALGRAVNISWVSVICCVAAYLIAGFDVLLTALRNIRRGEVFDENFLMAVASTGAMAVGESAEGVMVMLLYQLGEYLQDKAVDKSRDNIAALMDVRPDYANVLRNGGEERVSPETVQAGELILVRPGERIPLDGLVAEGASALDTAALTGESMPRDVGAGDSVLSGCVNLTGVLKLRVTAAYGQSTVAKILALVEESGEHKAKTERFITRFSRWYTPAVCMAAVLIALVPGLLTGEWQKWIYTALTFLVISCPCALVISVPLTFFSGIGGASRKGILIKGANHLESLAELDTAAFDKTGTLTKGVFRVAQILPVGMTDTEMLDLAAHAELHSHHPIARSLREACGPALDECRVTGVEDTPGQGVAAMVDGRRVLCGSDAFMQKNGIETMAVKGVGTIVHVAADGEYAGSITMSSIEIPRDVQNVLHMFQEDFTVYVKQRKIILQSKTLYAVFSK